MTCNDFEAVIAEIRTRAMELPDWRKTGNKRGVEILELCSPMSMHLVAEYVRIETLQFFESYCRFEILPEQCSGWIDGVEARELLLPYSSIVAIQVQRNADSDIAPYYTYRLIVSREYGHTEELENQYF